MFDNVHSVNLLQQRDTRFIFYFFFPRRIPYPSYDAHLTGTIISHILTLHITSLRTSTIGCNPFEQNSSIYTCMIVTISQVCCKKPSNHDYSRKP